MVSSAVEATLFIKVDQVDEELSADAAGEAARVPAGIWPGPGREDADVSRRQRFFALQGKETNGHYSIIDSSSEARLFIFM